MTHTDHIESLVTHYIRRELLRNVDAVIDPEESLFTSGYVDSVGIMRLIAFVEATLGLTIPPTDLVPGNFRTVRTMAAYLTGRMKGRSMPGWQERQAESA